MKVSVIIPVYNAAKYLPVCLESLAIQTMRDFEVIVVDDCSTDSSVAVAESFLEQFGGRMKIFSLPSNTGSGAVPRNVGLEHARGEYVYFVDADDLLIDNALEILSDAADTYKADVVYTEAGYICDEEPVPAKLEVAAWDADNIVEVPTFDTDDFVERMKKFLALQYKWPPWAKFLRRDFLIDNDIKFPPVKISEDVIWTFKVVCLAKKILRVPDPLYVQRVNEKSMMRRTRTPEQAVKFWLSPLIHGAEWLDEFMREIDYFMQNPAVRLQVLNLFANIHFQHSTEAFKTLEPEVAYEILLREFSAAGSSQPALIAYLLLMNNIYRNELMK